MSKVKSTQNPSNVRLISQWIAMFSSSVFFFQKCDFDFFLLRYYDINHIVARHGFVQFFLVLLTHLILPGLVLGSLICRAQRSRTPQAVARTGKDLPQNPAGMKVELLEEDMAFFFGWTFG